jgi:hypothetical protein
MSAPEMDFGPEEIDIRYRAWQRHLIHHDGRHACVRQSTAKRVNKSVRQTPCARNQFFHLAPRVKLRIQNSKA